MQEYVQDNQRRVVRHLKVAGQKTACGVDLTTKDRRWAIQATANKYNVTCIKCLGYGRNRMPSRASLDFTKLKLEEIPLHVERMSVKLQRTQELLQEKTEKYNRAIYDNASCRSMIDRLGKLVDEWREYEKRCAGKAQGSPDLDTASGDNR